MAQYICFVRVLVVLINITYVLAGYPIFAHQLIEGTFVWRSGKSEKLNVSLKRNVDTVDTR